MDIVLQAGSKPVCQQCGSEDWAVAQTVNRKTKLIRVDGLGDLEVEKPWPLEATQSIALICVKCGNSVGLQPLVQAWYQGGGEDGLGFPEGLAEPPERKIIGENGYDAA